MYYFWVGCQALNGHPQLGCWVQRGDGAKAREFLRAGGKLVVHCRGGIGRAGATRRNLTWKIREDQEKMMFFFGGGIRPQKIGHFECEFVGSVDGSLINNFSKWHVGGSSWYLL